MAGKLYNLSPSVVSVNGMTGCLLTIGFGQPATNDQIVQEVKDSMDELVAAGTFAGMKFILVNGPASLPVSFTVAHAVCHIVGYLGVFDPKLDKYVVSVSHGGPAVGSTVRVD